MLNLRPSVKDWREEGRLSIGQLNLLPKVRERREEGRWSTGAKWIDVWGKWYTKRLKWRCLREGGR